MNVQALVITNDRRLRVKGYSFTSVAQDYSIYPSPSTVIVDSGK